jgi:trimethylamine:corrinoid methyltransferase-like protein
MSYRTRIGVEQTTETEGPEARRGRVLRLSAKQSCRPPPAFRYRRCPVVPAHALSLESSPATCHEISADLLEKVGVRERSERAAIGKHGMERGGKTDKEGRGKREKRLSSDRLAGSLAAEFLKKIILLHGGCLAQQFKQGILQVFVLCEFVPGIWSGFELAQVCG